MLIYGSYAMNHWFDDFPRKASDIDLIQINDIDYDYELIQKLEKENLPIEIRKAEFFSCLIDDTIENFMTPDAMLTVRMSHALYNEHWYKAIEDIIFLQRKGAIHDIDKINTLREGWKVVHAGKRAKMNLKVTPDKFFNSNIKRIINHDELHEKLKLSKIPAYQKILKNNITVEVSKEKFDNLSFEEKLATVTEECLVLACERYYYTEQPRDAYKQALNDFITRMTNGWYNIFILENIDYFWNYNNQMVWRIVLNIMKNIKYKESQMSR